MILNYETNAMEVISLLEQSRHRKETVADHQRCYDGLKMYFVVTGRPPSMEAAIEWLETQKPNWAYSTYRRYRYALFRLENYLLHGNIACGSCRGLDDFAYKR